MLIGLTTSLSKDKDAAQANVHYLESISAAGAIPVLLPTLKNESDIDELLNALDGIVLTGGEDVNPCWYDNSDTMDKLKQELLARDSFEIFLAKKAYLANVPLLGICRGMQVMNVALGGSLYQDVCSSEVAGNNHMQKESLKLITHQVKITPESLLAKILPIDKSFLHNVNSSHHQSIKKLGSGLTVSAYSDDGLIEGIEEASKLFFIGVQWHPEYLEGDKGLFRALCEAAEKA